MQSIITQYHGATNTKPGRLSATTTSGIRRYYSITHTTDDAIAHRDAALALATELNWPEATYHSGAYNAKGALIWVSVTGWEKDTFKTPKPRQ